VAAAWHELMIPGAHCAAIHCLSRWTVDVWCSTQAYHRRHQPHSCSPFVTVQAQKTPSYFIGRFSTLDPVNTGRGVGACLRAGKPSWYVTIHRGRATQPSAGRRANEYQLSGWVLIKWQSWEWTPAAYSRLASIGGHRALFLHSPSEPNELL